MQLNLQKKSRFR